MQDGRTEPGQTRAAELVVAGLILVAAGLIGSTLVACSPPLPPGKPPSELTAQEDAGHMVYQQDCARCHAAHDTHALHGPSMLGVFRRPYLPSGSPAKDERVTSIVLHGRGMMPAFGNKIDPQQLQDLLAYLHTL